MKRKIDTTAILTPFSNAQGGPGGQDLRYTPVYDAIKEARRADDPFDRGDWGREVKRADWDQVITLCSQALSESSKDLQIAVWLTEGLINTEGYEGFIAGFLILNGFLKDLWDDLYPRIEDDDLDYRAAPIEFINDNYWVLIKQTPLTDPGDTPGYNWLQWEESRQVGREEDTRNQYGDVDDTKKKNRDELIADGKLTAETFDEAVQHSSRAFYEKLAQQVDQCQEAFQTFDTFVDEKFGLENAPRLAELRSSLEDCQDVADRLLKLKREAEPEPEPETEPSADTPETTQGQSPDPQAPDPADADAAAQPSSEAPQRPSPRRPAPAPAKAAPLPDEARQWREALELLKTGGMKPALRLLSDAANSAPSVRETTRYRLLTAKLCLKAKRPDLARPIVEELHALAEEINLERWESPLWIAELLDTLYRCLTAGEPSDEDASRAAELFRKLCTTDVTRAMPYKKSNS